MIFIAVDDRDGKAVGFTQLYPSFSSVSVRRLGYSTTSSSGRLRPAGFVGRRLLERAREWAVETGAKGLTLATATTNASARALYESCGWKRDEEFQHYTLLV